MKKVLSVLLIALLIPVVFAACSPFLNCNVKITPENPNITVKEFSGRCFSVVPKIINKGNSEIVLDKFYFQGKEYFVRSSTDHPNWNPKLRQYHLYADPIPDPKKVVIPPNYNAEIFFEDIWPARDLEVDVFILEGPSIKITGNIVNEGESFRCNNAEKTMIEILIAIVLAVLSVFLIFCFVKPKEPGFSAFILGLISFFSVWAIFFTISFPAVFAYSGVIAISAIIFAKKNWKENYSKKALIIGLLTLLQICFWFFFISSLT